MGDIVPEHYISESCFAMMMRLGTRAIFWGLPFANFARNYCLTPCSLVLVPFDIFLFAKLRLRIEVKHHQMTILMSTFLEWDVHRKNFQQERHG